MTPTPGMLTNFNAEFNSTFEVETVETLAPVSGSVQGYKIYSCKPSYGYIGALVNGSMVVKAKGDNWLQVESATEIFPGYYYLNKPSFIHGTQKQKKSEIAANKSKLQYPIVYLQEVESDDVISDRTERFGHIANCRLLFLIPLDAVKHDSVDRHNKFVKPMLNLANAWIGQLRCSKYAGEIEDNFQVIYHPHLGSTSEYGYMKDLLPESSAGVEMRIKVPIKKQHCNCQTI